MACTLDILHAGPHAAIQDRGRPGFQSQGVPEGGAMDKDALHIGNMLVGNQPDAAGIEFCIGGLSFTVSAAIKIALTGSAEDRLTITSAGGQSKQVPAGTAIWLNPDDRVETGYLRSSNCAFIALGGVAELPRPFGSASTSANALLGGIDGRLLKDGDMLKFSHISDSPALCCDDAPSVFALKHQFGVVLGPQQSWFEQQALHDFFDAEWRLTSKMSRMGIRLSGPVIRHRHNADILSDGIVTGAIQIPGDGQPIVMMHDHQTTGGYTKIAHMVSADLSSFARLPAGRKISFLPMTQEQAEEASISHHQHISRLSFSQII